MLTESQAWRMIGEAFEAKAVHPGLTVDSDTDLADFGLCRAALRLESRGDISGNVARRMDEKIQTEIMRQADDPAEGFRSQVFLQPRPMFPGGAEVRAMAAYLFAEATK